MSFLTLFSFYYQFIITQNYNPSEINLKNLFFEYKILDIINAASTVILLVGAFSYIFKKNILPQKKWKVVFKVLVGLVVFNLLYQIWPSNWLGNFSFLNGSLLTNIFAYLFVLMFYLPLYYSIQQLSLPVKPSKKSKK